MRRYEDMFEGYLESYNNPSQSRCGICGCPPSLYPTFVAPNASYGHVDQCVHCWLQSRGEIGAEDFDKHTEHCEKCDNAKDVSNLLAQEGKI